MIGPRLFLTLLVLSLSGCAATRTYIAPGRNAPESPPPAEKIEFEVFLIGNTGFGDVDDAKPVLRALSRQLQKASEESAVVFLGDQLDSGMPDSAAATRPQANRRLELIAESVGGFAGRVLVVPGDHDWDGPESLRRQEQELERLLGRDDVYLPGDARPGPVVLELNESLVLIGLDTAWWLEDDPKPFGDAGDVDDDEGEYEITNSGDVILSIEEALGTYDDENVLIVGHHPLRSNGQYGGQFTFGQHLLPLPIIGSAYPLFRQFAGTRQDLANKRYRAYRIELDALFRSRDRLIYASSHDRNLQAFPFDASVTQQQHYLISGTAATGEPVAAGRGAGLASSDRGFMRVRYFENGSVWLDAYAVDPSSGEAHVIYHSQLYDRARSRVDPEVPDIDPESLPSYADSTVVRTVEPDYTMGGVGSAILGTGYRHAWTTPVEFPVLDMSIHGGLMPIQRGGSGQTISLRLQGGNGHQYVFRLLRKYLGRNFSPELSESLAADILDELSIATIPWGPLAVTHLAEAAGIYHTNPQLVFIPDDPRLGVYREEFGNQLALFEERPRHDMSEFDNFGNSESVISSADMFEEVEDDNDHRVDERFFLRSRLFDMLLSDWDRHADQWRWATFEPFELDPTLEGNARTQGKIYRPIPRDRDYAFYRLGGLMPFIARQVNPKMQPFRKSYGNLQGLTTNGRSLDRRFTTSLSREDWIDIAANLRDSISDEDIEVAFAAWPPEIFAEFGEESIDILKARREQLPEIAASYYRLSSQIVELAGSNKHERFDVTILSDESVEVVIYKTNREGDVRDELYRRRFYPDQTREVRLYGLGGHDEFFVSGSKDSSIMLRVIGGAGEDAMTNEVGARVKFYDTITGNNVGDAGQTDLVLSDDPANNRYDPEDISYSRTALNAFPGYNSTDGIVINGNVTINQPGFRRHPWASTHSLSASFATSTGGISGGYSLRKYDFWGENWDTQFHAGGSTSARVNNFYGLGNETMPTSTDPAFHQVGLAEAEAGLSVIHRIEQSIEFQFGAEAEFRKVNNDSTRFVSTPEAALEPNDYEAAYYASGFASLVLNATDNRVNPRQGFYWDVRSDAFKVLNGPVSTFVSLGSDLSAYLSPSLNPQITIAGRVGIGHNLGDFPFYSAQTLGGSSNVRGLRRQRYSGRTSVYQNIEARASIVNKVSRTFPISIGVVGFLDNGRVWADDEISSTWHQGYGGGLWFNLLDLSVMSATVAQGDDGLRFNFGLGFFY